MFPLDDKTCFFYWFGENVIFRKRLGVATYFVLFLKGKQNKKKNLKCNSLFGKASLRKIESGPGVKLPIGKVRW